jgi:hypothetical protein
MSASKVNWYPVNQMWVTSAAAPAMLEALRMLITAWEDMHEESVAGIREHDLDIMNAAYGAAREAVDKAVASS